MDGIFDRKMVNVGSAKKNFVFSHPKLVGAATKVYNFLNLKNSLKTGKDNELVYNVAMLKNVKFIIEGTGNRVELGDFSRLCNCVVLISGNNNLISIGPRCNLHDSEFWIEDDENKIILGEHVTFIGNTHLAAIESTEIKIGDECLFAKESHFRTGDSHSILDENGVRINKSESITIGENCWIGMKVLGLKGIKIPDNSVVGAGALVTKQFDEPNCVIAGNPAKVLRRNVSWKYERV